MATESRMLRSSSTKAIVGIIMDSTCLACPLPIAAAFTLKDRPSGDSSPLGAREILLGSRMTSNRRFPRGGGRHAPGTGLAGQNSCTGSCSHAAGPITDLLLPLTLYGINARPKYGGAQLTVWPSYHLLLFGVPAIVTAETTAI